ncbi:WD40 repeat domain-containing protein [Saccharopolyspora erythraea]|uniref:Uncharacterized protein n=1 Tax=Saccharopolyspora erythraea TaxID=1836 RepID=A0ABP3NBP1_SACER|nr:WD40 repeat domain-containing protein [Saccharopolyspora erythraea]EQD86175.1 hypothetical protein N599_11095 [Saccharopolyspora erythraea D]
MTGHSDGIYDAAFSPDGRMPATRGRDAWVEIRAVASQRRIAAFRGHTGKTSAEASSSPTGTIAWQSLAS